MSEIEGGIKYRPGNPVRIKYGSYKNPVRILYESYGNKGNFGKSYTNPIQLLYESYTNKTFERYTTIKKKSRKSYKNPIKVIYESYKNPIRNI